MKKLKELFSSSAFNILLIAGLSALVVYLTVRDNPAEIFEQLKTADRGWLFVIVVAIIMIRVCSGLAIKTECNLTRPEYTARQGIENAFVGGLFNEITPSASGGQFAQVFLFRRQGVPVTEAAGVLWMNFIIYQTTMVISVFILILLKFHTFYTRYSQFFIVVLFGFALNAVVIVSLWAFVRFPKFYTWITTKGIEIGAKLHLIKDREKTLHNLDVQLKKFQQEIAVLSENKSMVFKVAGLHFARLMIYYSLPFLCARALHMDAPLSLLPDMITLASFVSMVTAFVPLPGASGGAEATFVLMFSNLFGLKAVRSLMLLWRFMSYYFDMMLGAVVFLIAKNRPEVTGFEGEDS